MTLDGTGGTAGDGNQELLHSPSLEAHLILFPPDDPDDANTRTHLRQVAAPAASRPGCLRSQGEAALSRPDSLLPGAPGSPERRVPCIHSCRTTQSKSDLDRERASGPTRRPTCCTRTLPASPSVRRAPSGPRTQSWRSVPHARGGGHACATETRPATARRRSLGPASPCSVPSRPAERLRGRGRVRKGIRSQVWQICAGFRAATTGSHPRQKRLEVSGSFLNKLATPNERRQGTVHGAVHPTRESRLLRLRQRSDVVLAPAPP